MGFRSLKRQIAKARMAATGAGNVNKKLSAKRGGVPNWKRALYGKTGKQAHDVQMRLGQIIKAHDNSKKAMKKRVLRKVTA